jgi:anti-anti-sigma factor
METGNKIKLDAHGNVKVLEIQGDVTILSEPFLKEAYQKAVQEEKSEILLKFEESAYINSGGIAVLIQLLAETQKNSQHVGITGLSEHFKKIFSMVGITKFAKIFDTVEEGVKGLSGSG